MRIVSQPSLLSLSLSPELRDRIYEFTLANSCFYIDRIPIPLSTWPRSVKTIISYLEIDCELNPALWTSGDIPATLVPQAAHYLEILFCSFR